jgi:hypothetical protein
VHFGSDKVNGAPFEVNDLGSSFSEQSTKQISGAPDMSAPRGKSD